MKIVGLVSDTHIPSRAKDLPESLFQAFQDVDLILHAGDFERIEIVTSLEKIAPLIAVHGNMCHYEVKKRFPKKTIIEIEKIKIGLTHGSGGPTGYYNRVLQEFKDENIPNIIVSGHTHKPISKIINNVQIINPGSPTDKYFTSQNTIALLKINGKEFQCEFIDLNK